MQGFWRVVLGAHLQPNQALEPTPNSLRSSLALAIGRGSPPAFGVLNGPTLSSQRLARNATGRTCLRLLYAVVTNPQAARSVHNSREDR